MAESGIFRINPLQAWQRDAILKAAALLREKFGNPPSDPEARAAHDRLLEVLDPARRTERLQKEIAAATRKAASAARQERRARERRKANQGPPPGVSERRSRERRNRN